MVEFIQVTAFLVGQIQAEKICFDKLKPYTFAWMNPKNKVFLDKPKQKKLLGQILTKELLLGQIQAKILPEKKVSIFV